MKKLPSSPKQGRPRKDASDCKLYRVQALFDRDEYKDLKSIVKEHGLPESLLVREAMKEWIGLYREEQERINKDE